MQSERSRYIVFIGSYAEPSDPGIFAYTLDTATGELALINSFGGVKNPCFLDIDHDNRKIYAVAEALPGENDEPHALALAFAFDPASGLLNLMSEQKTVGRATCHIHYDKERRMAVVTSYSGGAIGLLPVKEDGTLAPLADAHYHQGSGTHPTRQDRPHPHSSYARGSRLYVPDLGLDRIVSYEPDAERMKLIPGIEYAVAPGAGPRHMAFHPEQPYAYVINELDSTITVLKIAANGSLQPVSTVSTLPSGFAGDNTCAEIRITPDGRYLYGSNRGHDSIAVFKTGGAGSELELVEIRSSLGVRPRNFDISPDGRFLVAAHQDTGNLVVFRIDSDSGRLHDTGYRGDAPQGVCVRFWNRPLSV
ncbi:lactonase family protein [Paenibacillus hamazuiensis]|uniref:lactonase family protein n=1 Tax=Paenibacillus hamazuiensis TaxID=2936508 RepID=UPI00200C5341|nr:lactonase family protein [Paenibacillus hamazuiensis]